MEIQICDSMTIIKPSIVWDFYYITDILSQFGELLGLSNYTGEAKIPGKK